MVAGDVKSRRVDAATQTRPRHPILSCTPLEQTRPSTVVCSIMSASDSGSSEHGEIHLNSIREQLKECLNFGTAPKEISFMLQGARNSYPNQGVNIKDIGNIGLPISHRDIDAVKQASPRAPFGKGTDTIVDENVRKTWQIAAADLSCLNPRWESWVQEELLPRCCKALGVPQWMKPDIAHH